MKQPLDFLFPLQQRVEWTLQKQRVKMTTKDNVCNLLAMILYFKSEH